MNIKYGKSTSEFGPSIEINLDGDEVAVAIEAYLLAHNIYVSDSRTITVNNELCESGRIYVDPSGFIVKNGKKFLGNGKLNIGNL